MPGWAAGYPSMRRCQPPENVQATLSIHITNKPFKGLHLTYRAQPFFFFLPLQPFLAPNHPSGDTAQADSRAAIDV